MMKPWVSILFMIVISIVFVACSQESTSPPTVAPPTPPPTEAPQTTPPPPAPATAPAPATTVQPATEAAAAPVDANKGKTLLDTECVKCHNIEGRPSGFLLRMKT